MRIKKLLLLTLKPFGVKNFLDIQILMRYKYHFFFVIKMLKQSKSQISQDVFVASELSLWDKKKEPGFFVEFGGCDGLLLSNTFLLEKRYKWHGILAEPAKIWHEALRQNRTCYLDFRCVDFVSGRQVLFHEAKDGEYSTFAELSAVDVHSRKREGGSQYMVESISLNDLLLLFKAPTKVSYLSIDTEGSEFEILKSLDFDYWEFEVITVEHNYTANRSKIHDLLSKNGYERVFANQTKFDDWYTKSTDLHSK